MKHIKKFESLISKKSVDQFKKVSNELGKMDIGKRVSDDSFSNSLDSTKRDVTKTKIQTYADYMNEPFTPNQNRKPWKKRTKKEKQTSK